MIMRRYALGLFSLLLVSAPSSALIAQDPEQSFRMSVDVDMVELSVSVTDERDRPIGSLQKENFKILEDQVEQPIVVFRHEDIPLSLGLVVDNSRSMEPRKERLDAAATSFVRQSNPEDETFVVHFDSDARLTRGFTHDVPDLEKALASVQPFGETAIYDAIGLAIGEMGHARYRKKAILLITDGVDNVSHATLDQTVELVKRGGVAVYIVGLLSASGGIQAEESLIRLADASGGHAFFPSTVDEAHAAMERVARDLREQYTIGYFPTNPDRNGAWRSVRVEIALPGRAVARLNAKYRHGYYGPEDRQEERP
ncbi:MAG TPA: VWA domain-containing protein [Terriglobia bacterium]|nr:VWA domain-containing protein [Terriglobia bacterium]